MNNRGGASLRGAAARLAANPALTYSGALMLLAAGFLLRYPIRVGDFDLWMWLAAGRYISQHHAVPTEAFFSFLLPPRPWLDYSWLTQLVLYQVYAGGGYFGLVVLRAAVHLATSWLILRFLFGDDPRESRGWYAAWIFALTLLVLIFRSRLVRPHLFSYFLIMAFLQILEARPERAALLPGLAVLFCNLHGIYYPVLFLILGAYLAERYRHGGASQADPRRRCRLPLALSFLAVLATPHGWRLLALPFVSAAHMAGFVTESHPFSWRELPYVSLRSMALESGAFDLLLLSAVLSAVVAASERRARVSHWLLFAGGLGLLTMGPRATHECALLLLPMLRGNPPLRPGALKRMVPGPVRAVVLAAFVAVPAFTLRGMFGVRLRYPLSLENIPQGIAAFLRQVPAGGSVLNYPDSGGYLEWALYPKYRIFMDLKVPHVFTDADFDEARWAYAWADGLRAAVRRHHPSFIAAPLTLAEFPRLIAGATEYVAVFFDDAEALYVDRGQYPALAREYALPVDPFHLEAFDAQGPHPPFLRRMIAIDPHCRRTRLMAAWMDGRRGDYAAMREEGRAVVEDYPELPEGYAVLGDALRGLMRWNESIAAYRDAADRSAFGERAAINKKIAAVQFGLGRTAEAFAAMRRAVDVDSPDTAPRDFLHLAVCAVYAGKDAEARSAFNRLYPALADRPGEWPAAAQRDLARWGSRLDE